MKTQGIKLIMAVLGMVVLTLVSIDLSQAREMEQQKMNPLQSDDIKAAGQKKGGTPAPPPNPQCPIGSSQVGPMTTSSFSRACKVNGQDGTQSCSSKFINCLSGAGEPDHAYTESCGPCMALLTQPGQTQTPTGR